MAGIQLKHPWITNDVYVVENPKRPYGDGGYWCNICPETKHVAKATHLWMGPNGDCLVSTGVLEELKRAGMPNLTVIGSIDQPPPLRIGKLAKPRDQQENEHRAIHVFRHIPEADKAKAS